MARPTKYNDEIAAEIVALLTDGCVIADVCSKVGISQDSYFTWIKRYPEFSESVKRAKAEANVGAAQSLRTAMMPHDTVSKTVKVVKETRLRKVRGEFGVSEVPYEWVKSEQSQTTTNEFDWRAALEFLKRRDPDNWAETFIIKVTPDQQNLLKAKGISASDLWAQMMQELANDAAEH